jgi:hypothetical protein
MFKKVASFFAATFLAVAAFAAPTPVQAAPKSASFEFPLSGQGATGAFNGVLRITSFAVQNNQVVASGIVTGTMATANGLVSVARTVTVPVITGAATRSGAVAAAATGCEILHLELGPLDLDLLGLVIHLDRIVLDITAVPGAGNLLGNLLCAVTNLLNGAGALAQIANLLNQILAILG